MKSIADLEKIRQATLSKVNLRRESEGTRIVVGMATCGIAAGARPVMNAFVDEVAKRNAAEHVVSADKPNVTGNVLNVSEPFFPFQKPAENQPDQILRKLPHLQQGGGQEVHITRTR